MPPPSLLDALITAAYSGIEIKILLPKEAVHFKKIITVMTKKNYQKLLAAQIKIYEYQGFNHEKTILVDYDLVYTGSYNWDYRSLLMNYETILQISSQEINYNLQQAYLKRLSNSQEITQNHLKQIYR